MNTSFRQQKLQNTETKQSFLFRFIKLIIWLAIIVGAFCHFSYKNFVSQELIKEEKLVHIDSSDSFLNLGNKVAELDNIWYKIYIKNNAPDFSLQEGNYRLEGGETVSEILEALDKPIYEEMTITFLEGRNIYDIDYYLTDKGIISSGDYISYVTNINKITQLGEFYEFIDGQMTLEGFLYPDTYKINIGDFKINNLVIKQLDTFETKVYNEILTELTIEEIDDLVNLASIVEKEEKNNNEKPTVAGILKKRLDNGWMIGADITVCYPHELTSQECKMVVSKYITEVSDYNTRTKIGLPLTPIGNPSFETIEATLNYKETPYWFYLHNVSTGQIYYGETNADHEYNKRYMY